MQVTIEPIYRPYGNEPFLHHISITWHSANYSFSEYTLKQINNLPTFSGKSEQLYFFIPVQYEY